MYTLNIILIGFATYVSDTTYMDQVRLTNKILDNNLAVIADNSIEEHIADVRTFITGSIGPPFDL